MAILRALKYILIVAFHPMAGYGMFVEDPNRRAVRILMYWMSFGLLMTLIYFMLQSRPNLFEGTMFLHWFVILMIKFGGIMFFFFFIGIAGIIVSIDAPQLLNVISALYGSTMLPEFLFIVLTYFWPEHYEYFRFFAHIWRGTIMVIGAYLILETSWRNACIFGVLGTLTLYFANYNYFSL